MSFVDSHEPKVRMKIVLITGSDVDQIPTGLDVITQVSFGAAVSVPELDLAANGSITFKETGTYSLIIGATLGREGNSQNAHIVSRQTVDGFQLGNTIVASLPTKGVRTPILLTLMGYFTAGQVYKIDIVRDSQGTNDGGLYAETTTNFANVPSAGIVIQKFI